MLEKWYQNSKIPVFLFFAISVMLLYFGRNFNSESDNHGKSLCYTIEVFYPGMSGSFLEREITTPLENNLSSIKEISEIRSVSEDNKVSINIYFEKGADKMASFCNLSNAIDDFYGSTNHPIQRPSIYFSDSNISPDFLYAIYKDDVNKNLETKVDKEFLPLLEGLKNVSKVLSLGNDLKEVIVAYCNDKLLSLKINPNDLAAAIQKTNPFNSSISLESKYSLERMNVLTKFPELAQLSELQIRINNQYIKFNELASFGFKDKEKEEIVKLNGKNCIEIEIWATNTANKIFLSKQIQEKFDAFFKTGEYVVLHDSGKEQFESLKKISFALIQSLVLIVILIPLIFRGEKILCPIIMFFISSLVWTIFLLSALKIGINHFVIAGISISLGINVDPILIISELKSGKSNNEFLREFKKVLPTLISSIGTNLIVFIPFFGAENLVPGISILITSMILMSVISFFIALVFFPWVLLQKKNVKLKMANGNFGTKNFVFNRRISIFIYAALILLSFVLLVSMEKDSTLKMESIIISASLEYNPEKMKEYIDEKVMKIVEEIKKEEGIEDVLTVCRKGNCQLSIKYNKKKLKKKNIKNITFKLNELVKEGFIFIDDGLTENNGKHCMEIAIEGKDPMECRKIAEKAVTKFKDIFGVEEVVLNFKSPEKAIELIPKYDFLRYYGSSPVEFGQTLYWNMNTPVIDKYKKNKTEYDVRLKEIKSADLTLDNMLNKNILIGENLYKITDCVSTNYKEEIGNLYRKNSRDCAYCSVYVKSSEVKKVKNKIQKIMEEMQMGEGYTYSFDRQTMDFEENCKTITIFFFVAVILLFILLTALNEKPFSSLLILSIIPASFAFPLGIKLFRNSCLCLGDFMGMALSAGIVVNNAILIESNGLETNYKSIFITNITTIIGSIPVLLSDSSGYIKDLSFHMMFSSIAALIISFVFFPYVVMNFKKYIG